jgi:protein-S-isoprenylcysteine O-methyltransferase Ste14
VNAPEQPYSNADVPGVAVFPPALFAGTLVLGLLLYWMQPLPLLSPRVARASGLLLLILSGWLARSAEIAMKRAGTNIRPDRPSVALVTQGPFRFSRNPMYLAATGLYLAVTLLVNTLWPVVLLIPMLALLQWGVIRREERYLDAKFPEEYPAYRARVRRWL